MLAFGVFVLVRTWWVATQGGTPKALTMGAIGLIALIANVSVAAMLYAWREGDANMRSVWLCSRNDAIGNLAVILAAFGVFGTRQRLARPGRRRGHGQPRHLGRLVGDAAGAGRAAGRAPVAKRRMNGSRPRSAANFSWS